MTSHSDLADNILPSDRPTHLAPLRHDFRPWHKVRKQYVRQEQWNELTARMVKRYLKAHLQNEAADWSLDEDPAADPAVSDVPESVRLDRPLRCLVIPGDDLLDIRSLWEYLQPLGCYIRYLGFNESHGSDQIGTRIHIANNEVTSLSRVAHDSHVLADRFQAIVSHQSQAYRLLREYGPYHVVNLDLCDSLFPTAPGDPSRYLSALHRLAEYQMMYQTTPWLLFVTSQVEPAAACTPELQKLCQPITINCQSHPVFAPRLGTLFRLNPYTVETNTLDISSLDDEEMVRIFGLALGKWLISLSMSCSPSWIAQMLTSHRYCIKATPRVEMLSLAFQFRPKHLPPRDPTGLSTAQMNVPTFPTELDSATKLIEAVERIRDVDELLNADAELWETVLCSSADLLESAGYDRDSYLAWVAAGEAS